LVTRRAVCLPGRQDSPLPRRSPRTTTRSGRAVKPDEKLVSVPALWPRDATSKPTTRALRVRRRFCSDRQALHSNADGAAHRLA
jgi:hypothetical protein